MTKEQNHTGMINMDTMPLRWGHIRILITSSIEQFLGGVLAVLVGVVAPLIQISHHPELSSWIPRDSICFRPDRNHVGFPILRASQ